MCAAVAERPDAFEPKDRWAMDWYYPVLTGALDGEAAKARLADGWDDVRHGGQGHPLRQRRAVGHRVGDRRVRAGLSPPSATATRRPTCCAWTRAHRRDDGVVLDRARLRPRQGRPTRFPFEEHTSYTAAAVILAADAIAGASPASALFTPRPLLD